MAPERSKGLNRGSERLFMSLPTKGFVMNGKPQETKAFRGDEQLCSIHQRLLLACTSLPAREEEKEEEEEGGKKKREGRKKNSLTF